MKKGQRLCGMSKAKIDSQRPRSDRATALSLWLIFALTLLVPTLVLPGLLDNAFNAPKNLLILIGAAALTFLYGFRYLRGRAVPFPQTSPPPVLLLLILLNLFSFFFTANPYYTVDTAVLNLSCLLIFYFVGLYADGRWAYLIMTGAVVSGLLVAIETHLQFSGCFLLFRWAYKGIMVMGTIGNSNYLGAYFIFPLYATTALLLLQRGRLRLIPAAVLLILLAAFLFTRARAGWFGFFISLPLFLFLVKRILRVSLWERIHANPRRVATYVFALSALLLTLWYAAPQRFHTMMGFRNVTRSDTFRLRTEKYFRASWWLLRQNPLFGTGLGSFRNLVYEAQARINLEDKDYFKNYPEPKPRRVHNDYLEALNDGGITAFLALALFVFTVMRHGWSVIRKESLPEKDRIIVATAFSAVLGIMLAALFFFPFRLNSTLFMTVLMMGLIEGIYMRTHDRLMQRRGFNGSREAGLVLGAVLLLVLCGLIWYAGIKPFKGEMAHFKYKMALADNKHEEARAHILKALKYDPHNTSYLLYAGELYRQDPVNLTNPEADHKNSGKALQYFDRAIERFNGDITFWALHFLRGLVKFKTGSLYEAEESFEKALYYYPLYEPAAAKLAEVRKVIKDHDQVLIRIR